MIQMLKVIQGGGIAKKPSVRSSVRSNIVVKLPVSQLSPSEMIRIAIKSGHIVDDTSILIETFPSVAEFANKLASLVTHVFPATDENYPSLLVEVLDLAMIGYVRSSPKEPREQIARFLANGVFACAQGLMAYRAVQIRGTDVATWVPWEDGALSEWAVWGADIEFKPETAPTPEIRHAMSMMLQQRLLSWNSMVNIARAGIDMQSMNLF